MKGIEAQRGGALARSGAVPEGRRLVTGARRAARFAALGLSAALGGPVACAGQPPAPPPASPPAPAGYPRELKGIASDGATVFVALATAPGGAGGVTAIEAIPVTAGRPGPALWRAALAGDGGRLVRAGTQLVAALDRDNAVARGALRVKGSVEVTTLDAATGAIAWRLPIAASQKPEITSLVAIDGGVIIGGSFVGTLRLGARELPSAGEDDGFVARLTASGEVAWLVRVGGPGADAVLGVAVAGDRVAIAGTCAAGADLLGQPLPRSDERSSAPEVFVAELGAAGTLGWAQAFFLGNARTPAVAGVVIDARGRVAVAANGRASGLVTWWLPGGAPGPMVLIGVPSADDSHNRLRAIAAVGDRVVVAGALAGRLRFSDRVFLNGRRCEHDEIGFSATLNVDGARGPALSAGDMSIDAVRAIAAPGERVVVAAFDGHELFVTEPHDGDWATLSKHKFMGRGGIAITDLLPTPGGFLASVADTPVRCHQR